MKSFDACLTEAKVIYAELFGWDDKKAHDVAPIVFSIALEIRRDS